MGSASLFFDLSPNMAILGDLNSELVQCFDQVKSAPKSVHWHLSRFRPGPDFFYELRSQDPAHMSLPKRAARMIYLSRYCFNGLYRTNSKGQFNVPYGGYKSGQLPTANDLVQVSERLSKTKLMCADFEETIEHVKKKDFVYMDPPYSVPGKRRTNQYGPDGFSHLDLIRLENALQKIDKRGAYFVLSYEDSDEAASIMESWNVVRISVRRNVAGFARHRRSAAELIATNISR